MHPPFFDRGKFELPSFVVFKLVWVETQASKPVRFRSIWEMDHMSMLVVILITKVIYRPTTVVSYPFD